MLQFKKIFLQTTNRRNSAISSDVMKYDIICEIYSPSKHNFPESGKTENHNSVLDKQKLANWDGWPGFANIIKISSEI